eukprot:5354311-Prymnesium_polylepis.1
MRTSAGARRGTSATGAPDQKSTACERSRVRRMVAFLSDPPHAKSAPSTEKLPKYSCRTQRRP